MGKDALRAKLYMKLYWELAGFKERMLQLGPEGVFNCAYEIDSKVAIYELLAELVDNMGVPALRGLLNAGSLIDACYKAWLGTEDSHMAELGDCVAGTLKAMQRPERKKEGRKYEETGVNAGDGKRRVAQLQETRDRRE